MSTRKKFDLTTLFVILVSIALILLGMYFLNQSFTKKSSSFKPEQAATKNINITTTSSSTFVSYISSASRTEISSLSIEKSALSSANSSSNTASVISITSSSSSLSTSSKNTSPLNTSEAKIKVLQSIGGGTYEVQIIETGIKEPKFWIKDKKLKINNNSNLKIDTEYRVGEITETSNSFNYGSIEE